MPEEKLFFAEGLPPTVRNALQRAFEQPVEDAESIERCAFNVERDVVGLHATRKDGITRHIWFSLVGVTVFRTPSPESIVDQILS
jgi:hypothetical protein